MWNDVRKQYIQIKCLHENSPKDISYGWGELWLACFRTVYKYYLDTKIPMATLQGDLFAKRQRILQTRVGVLVNDTRYGLDFLSRNDKKWYPIFPGHFSGFCFSYNTLFALSNYEATIYIFYWNGRGFGKGPEYKLKEYFDPSEDDRLCTDGSNLYISSYYKHTILVYSMTGEFVYKTGGYGTKVGEFRGPYVAGCDTSGNILVCDSMNDRLQVFNKWAREWSIVKGCESVQCPIAATFSDKFLWVVSSPNRVYTFQGV